MTGHPSKSRLERFMHGELPPEQNREVVRHLVRGCDDCTRITAPLWEIAVTGRAAEAAEASEYEAAFDRAWQRAASAHAEIETERDNAEALCRELLQVSPHQQRLKVRNDPRLHTLAVCDAVIAAAESSAFDDAAEARNRAELAREITDRLDPARYGAGNVADAKASAWASYANALRNASDYSSAVRALETARMYLDEGTGDPARKSKFLAHLGSLLTAKGHMNEALSAYRQLEAIYARLGDRHMIGRVQLKKAVVHHKSREPEKVIPLLEKAIGLLDPARDPRRQTIALHNLILALIEAGRPEEAVEHVGRLRHMHAEQGGRLNLVRFRWLEGRLAYALGDLEEARRCYGDVRDSFIDLEIGIDVALASLDLSQVLFDLGDLHGVQERLTEAIPILKALEVHAEATAAVAFLEESIRAEAAGAELIRQTADFVRRVQRDPSIRFQPSEVASASTQAVAL